MFVVSLKCSASAQLRRSVSIHASVDKDCKKQLTGAAEVEDNVSDSRTDRETASLGTALVLSAKLDVFAFGITFEEDEAERV